MPTYARFFTPRFRALYHVAGHDHHVQIRPARGTVESIGVENSRNAAFVLFNTFASLLASDFAWVSADYAPQGTDSFHPVAVPDEITGTITDWETAWSPVKKVRYIEFTGKSEQSGTSVKAFGLDIDCDEPADLGATGLISSLILPGIITVADALNDSAHAVSGQPCVWNTRVTHKTHDKLLKDVRRTGG